MQNTATFGAINSSSRGIALIRQAFALPRNYLKQKGFICFVPQWNLLEHEKSETL
jgi:hypothetical protein